MLRMRRDITMNMGACIGYQNTLINHLVNDSNNDTLSKHVDQTFFDDKNYRWIIRCLNNGYEVSMDVIEFMEDYNNLLQIQIRQWNGYSKQWRERLQNRSQLASYKTTNQAQIQTISSPESNAELIQTLCGKIQEVINTYRRQVDRMYPKERLGFGHKHDRSEQMERFFKDAYSDRQRVADKLQRLQSDEKTAGIAVREAAAKCESLELNDTTEKSELFKAKTRLEKKESKLQAIKTRIARTEVEYNEAQGTYRRKATAIYEQCRNLEEERLNQIRETLIKFNQAIHSIEYSNKQTAMYEKLILTIESEQKTRADLDSWAQTYHIIDLPQRTLSDTAEDEEDQSVADKPTSPHAKSKLKRKKSSTTEPKTPQ